MKTEHFMVSTLDFVRVFFVKNFFTKFELLNSGCGLSASLYGNAYMAISCDNLYFCPLALNMFHAPFKSFSFHSITAGHFTNLNYLSVI